MCPATVQVVATTISGNVASNNYGGLYAMAEAAFVRDCQILDNVADANTNGTGIGGGLYFIGTALRVMADTQRSMISGNRAALGGGVYAATPMLAHFEALSPATPLLISGNTASGQGGALAFYNGATADVYGAVMIVSNTANVGGGVFVSNMAACIAHDTNGAAPALNANLALTSGGGAAAYGVTSRLDFLNVTIAGNRAHATSGGGGGVYVYDGASARLVNVHVLDNLSSNIGGGVLAVAGGEVLVDSDFSAAPPAQVPPSQFIGNHAVYQVGGIYAYAGASAIVKNALIISNTAGNACGGFAALTASGQVINTILAHNRGGTIVDGVAFQFAPLASLQNCTIVDNGAIGFWSHNSTPAVLENTIIWGHTNRQIIDTSVTSVVNFCAIEGGYPGLFNCTNDPEFSGRATLDFQLEPSSPCIDKGATLVSVLNDCIGEVRPYGLGWDIGAYEFVPEPAGLGIAVLALLFARRAKRHR